MSERVSDYALRGLEKLYASRLGGVEADTAAALRELIELRAADASKPDDSEPITAEWWHDVFGGWSVKLSDWLYLDLCPFNPARDWRIYLVTADGQHEHKLPHIKTRGDLRRLWVALTGRELDERKAGE